MNITSVIQLKAYGQLQLGTHTDVRALRQTIRVRKQNDTLYGEKMMFCEQFVLNGRLEEVDVFIETSNSLVNLNPDSILFKENTLGNIFKEGVNLGLELCPAEVGPQFLRQFGSRLPDGTYYIAMEAISYAPGNSFIFLVERWKKPAHLYVEFYKTGTQHMVTGNEKIVFIKRK